jgi:hypothetical protein
MSVLDPATLHNILKLQEQWVIQALRNIKEILEKAASIWGYIAFLTSLNQYVAQVKFLMYSKYYILHWIII